NPMNRAVSHRFRCAASAEAKIRKFIYKHWDHPLLTIITRQTEHAALPRNLLASSATAYGRSHCPRRSIDLAPIAEFPNVVRFFGLQYACRKLISSPE